MVSVGKRVSNFCREKKKKYWEQDESLIEHGMKAFALNLCKVQLRFAAKMKNRFRLSFGTLSLSLSLPLPADQSDREKARLFS